MHFALNNTHQQTSADLKALGEHQWYQAGKKVVLKF